MISSWHPWKIILLGIIMMLISIALPLLMVLHLIRSTFFLNFLAFVLSVSGMLIGFIGMVFYVKLNRR